MQGCFSQERHSGPSVATSPAHPTSTYGAPIVYQVVGHSELTSHPGSEEANVGHGLTRRLLGKGQDACAEILKCELGLVKLVRDRK